MKVIQVGLFMVLVLIVSLLPNSFADSSIDSFKIKGVADRNGPFANQAFEILGDGNNITITRESPNNLVTINVAVSIRSHCYDVVPTICIGGIVSKAENSDSPVVGDLIRLNIDPSGKKQTISFLTGDREGTSVIIHPEKKMQSNSKDIQKLILVPEKNDPLTLVSRYEEVGMINAIQKAKEFAVNHPTFSFDGISESLDANLVSIIKTKPQLYVVELTFDSEHTGYGDRSGHQLKNMVTHHVMKVMISDYGVGSAKIDGIWDEFNQKWLL